MEDSNKEIIQDILTDSKLSGDSKLFRYTSLKYLIEESNGGLHLKVNPDAKEMVVDPYDGNRHVFMANEIGPGLSFLSEPLEEYEKEDRVCVSTTVEELLSNGAKVYNVTSLPTYIKAFFFSIASDRVKVIRE